LPTMLDPLPDKIPEEDVANTFSADLTSLLEQGNGDPREDVSMPLSARSPHRKHHHDPFDFKRLNVHEIRDALLEDSGAEITTMSVKSSGLQISTAPSSQLIPNNLQRTLTRTPTSKGLFPFDATRTSTNTSAPSTPKVPSLSRRETPVGFSYTEDGHIKEVHYFSLQPKPRPNSAELRRRAGNLNNTTTTTFGNAFPSSSSGSSFDVSNDLDASYSYQLSSSVKREPSIIPERPGSGLSQRKRTNSPERRRSPSPPKRHNAQGNSIGVHSLHNLQRLPTAEKIEVITKTHVPAGIPSPILQKHGSMINIPTTQKDTTTAVSPSYQLIRPPTGFVNPDPASANHFNLLTKFYQEKQQYDAEIAQKRYSEHNRKRNLLNVTKISEYQRSKERTTLMGIYDMCGGERWHRSDNWGSMELPVSEWYGVVTNVEGAVIEINLPNNNLFGEFPDILHELKYLEVINVDNNSLCSPIADYALQQCHSLKIISACHNQLYGTVPFDYFCDLKSLQEVWLHNNQFTGTLQQGLYRLANTVTHISLDHNHLTGQISPQISKLQNLQYLSLSCNAFHGEIPHSIIGLHRLEVLSLHSNKFTGRIPELLDSIPSLYDIRLYNNEFENSQTAVVDQLLNTDMSMKMMIERPHSPSNPSSQSPNAVPTTNETGSMNSAGELSKKGGKSVHSTATLKMKGIK
jgi:hypothetical protein